MEKGRVIMRTGRHRVLVALSPALLLLVVLLLGCNEAEERQNASGRSGEQSTGGIPGPAAEHGLVCGASWNSVPSSRKLHDPRGIAARSKNDIWVVGRENFDRDMGGIKTGAEHWNGRRWSLFPTPNLGAGEHVLNGVNALTREDVWAVGYSNNETLIERWNGTRWGVVNSPNAGPNASNTLTSVDALSSTDGWAVGSYLTATSRKTLIQRWDGTSWNIVSSPNPATLSNSLLSVAAADAKDVWAVGWKSSGEGLRSLILHRDGARWKEVAVPTVGTGDNVLTGVSARRTNDVWATGYYVDGTKHKTLTLHYDGTAWSRVPSANGGGGLAILRGIGAFSPTEAWAVGFEYRADLHHYVASTQRWDGSSWTAVPSAISEDTTKASEMHAVAKARGGTPQVWAVGRPADVELICPSESLRTTAPAREETDTPTGSSAQTPQQPSAVSAESPVSSASAAPTSGGTQVIGVDKAADAGIHELTTTYGAVVADLNNDDRPDIFLGRHNVEEPRFYVNEGNGRFKETNKGTFAKKDRHGCDAADVNGDGLEDIFCSTGAKNGTAAKRNELYLQRPDHTFVDQAGKYGVFDPFGRGRLGTFINANGDARPDLFVANEAYRGDAMPSPNRFFVNRGKSAYHHAPEYGLEREMVVAAEISGSGASVGDLDKDGWEDLVLATSSGLRVYHNDQGKGFTDVAASVGLEQSPEAVTLADVNGDSWPDVIEVSTNELRILLNKSGTFSSAFTTTVHHGSMVAAGDVNGDDRPDIYVMRGDDDTGVNTADHVYLNAGNGTSFTRMSSIPSTSKGTADFVAPIDHDGNGLTDFLVLNGSDFAGKSEGPVQLIAFFRIP